MTHVGNNSWNVELYRVYEDCQLTQTLYGFASFLPQRFVPIASVVPGRLSASGLDAATERSGSSI